MPYNLPQQATATTPFEALLLTIQTLRETGGWRKQEEEGRDPGGLLSQCVFSVVFPAPKHRLGHARIIPSTHTACPMPCLKHEHELCLC